MKIEVQIFYQMFINISIRILVNLISIQVQEKYIIQIILSARPFIRSLGASGQNINLKISIVFSSIQLCFGDEIGCVHWVVTLLWHLNFLNFNCLASPYFIT